jgi:glycosyltransferase involved in cell wall biosynthesis
LRTVLFFRKYRRFHGGHLKVWHYFNHTLATDGFDARVLFDVDSNWDTSNPWSTVRDLVVEAPSDVEAQAYFVAGRDWQRMEALGLLERDIPIINFIQHTRHAGDWSIQSRYLKRKAIRICVSDEVAQAVENAGSRGRTIVIPNSVDVPVGTELCQERTVDLLIAGLKQPEMAIQAAAALQKPGRTIEVLDDHIPREEFLAKIGNARNVLFLPNREEGFYLPALEGMALGALVICPDCIGNRGFMNGRNAMFPGYEFTALIEATETAMMMPERERTAMLEQARATVARHQPAAERAAYSDVLRNLDRLWSEA